MSLGSAIKAKLDGDASLRALIATRSYAVRTPDGAKLPYVTWSLISETPLNAMGSDGSYRVARVQFDSYGISHTQAAAVDEAIRAALNRYRGTSGGTVIQDVLTESASDGYLPEADAGVYHVTRDLRIFYE